MDKISSPPSSPPSSFSHNWKHHVFTSFHGPDVRKSFLSHFFKECKSKGIDAFDDNEIPRGEFIGPELKKAIRGSRIAIVLLSENYASSSWCLDELVEIMKCNENLGYTVMTIFYEVDPSDVKKQTGEFGKVFEETCQRKPDLEQIGRWRKALAEVATIAGYDSRNWDKETEMIEEIVTNVSNKLNNSTPSMDFEGLVGMKIHMEKMRPLLRLDLDEVRMIGISGTPGIGKTTIAKFLFNRHSKDFQLSVFMANIKRTCTIPDCSNDHDAKLLLQQKFMSQITKEKDIQVPNLGIAKDRLKDKKVLVVLDDVDQLVQLEAMVKETCWFGPWSRIIITTQDEKLLRAHGISHIYKVPLPPSDEALQMFRMYAFSEKSPKDGFRELALEVTYIAGKLPLGLQVMGSYFQGLSMQDWSMELPRVRANLNEKIESILRFSYDALCVEDKDLFIHIACFFNSAYMNKVVGHLEKSFSGVSRGLRVLAEKSLISIDSIDQDRIGMHSLLAQLGKEIVRKQSNREPGERQFLVDGKDIVKVLTDPTAITRSVIGIDSSDDLNNDRLNISESAFERMSNLQFLRLNGGFGQTNIASLMGCLKFISPKLQLLDWKYSPMTCLPFIVSLEFLVELNMPQSRLKKLWNGIKLLRNLKWMDLSYSGNLKELPNLSTATNLQTLDLSECSSLEELPFSIGNAVNLQKLDLSGCSNLVKLPSSIGNATNLQTLDLSECLSLEELPFSIGNAINLQNLDLSCCPSLEELPSLTGNAVNLQKLVLRRWSNLVELPSSIGNATNLRELSLSGCSGLVKLPFSIGNATNLQTLDLSECFSLEELPSSIGNATNLQQLYLSGCSNLVELPSSIGNATNLQQLYLTGCSNLVELPSSIGNATNLQQLYLSGCSNLKELPSSIGNAINLQKLVLSGCSNLVELPSSIGNLTNLQDLDILECSSLAELPSSIGNATNLQKLKFSGCSSLVELPSSVGNATGDYFLNFSRCSSLMELPSWIGNKTNLTSLYLDGCSSLIKLPSSIGNTTNLRTLSLKECSSLMELPSSIGTNLQELDLSRCSSLVELPSWIENATNPKYLNFNGCSRLVKLPSSFGNSIYLQELDISGCSSLVELPSGIGNAAYLQKLNLSGCSSLVELPSWIGNLHSLSWFTLEECSKLEVFPTNINLKSLNMLNLTNCSSLKSFPEISTNIEVLKLRGTAVEEVPSSIRSWSRLEELHMSYSENLKEFPHAFDRITELHLTDTGIQELSPWVKEFSRLHRLVLNEMQNLVSLPQLPDSLMFLDAENCVSLERLDCSFRNPDIVLNFRNCFKLNQEARDLIIHTPTSEYSVLPGGEVPACFTYRASGSSVTVKLNEKPLRTTIKFKACVLLVSKSEDEWLSVDCRITSKQTSRKSYGAFLTPALSEQLHIFEVEAKKVTSTELVFKFKLEGHSDPHNDAGTWKVKECGILKLLELQDDEDSESSDQEICALTSRSSKRRRVTFAESAEIFQ